MKVINLCGGPGVGKSTLAADLFTFMKKQSHNVELVTEYAKQLTWEGRTAALSNQIYVFAKQLHQLHRLQGQVEYIVTDSPLFLSLVYKPEDMHPAFDALVMDTIGHFDNINFLLKRDVKYVPEGRNQTLKEAVDVDKRIKTVLDYFRISYEHINPTDTDVLSRIAQKLEPAPFSPPQAGSPQLNTFPNNPILFH